MLCFYLSVLKNLQTWKRIEKKIMDGDDDASFFYLMHTYMH